MKIKQKKGMALLIVIFTLILVASIVGFLQVKVVVDSKISKNFQDKVQAYYLAKSMANLSLLRLSLYKEVRNIFDRQDPENPIPIPITSEMIDQIWSLPLPPLPLQSQINLAKEEASNTEEGEEVEGSGIDRWPGTITSFLKPEGSKIPINLLDGNENFGSNEDLKNEVKRQLENLFNGYLEREDFSKLYRDMEAKDLIDPIIDWVDENEEAESRGDENREYERLNPPYKTRNGRINSITELHLIKGWTDDLYNRFKDNFSVLNNKATINPNYVTLDRLKAIDPKLTDEDLSKVTERRLLDPFKNLEDLEKFIQDELPSGTNFEFNEKLKGHMTETNFIVEATGNVVTTTHTIKIGIRIRREEPTKRCLKKSQNNNSNNSNNNKSPPTTPSSPPNPGNNASGSQKPVNKLKLCGEKCKDLCKLQQPEVLFIQEPL